MTKVKGSQKLSQMQGIKKSWFLIAGLLILFTGGLFFQKVQTEKVTLANGEVLTFTKGKAKTLSLAGQVTQEEISPEKIKKIFNHLPVTGVVYVSEKSQEIISFEGEIGQVKLLISKGDENLLDAQVAGKEKRSQIKGIPVTAGFFTSSKNSQGLKTTLYYATFKLGENTIYLENAGTKKEKVKKEFATILEQLIENGPFSLAEGQE